MKDFAFLTRNALYKDFDFRGDWLHEIMQIENYNKSK